MGNFKRKFTVLLTFILIGHLPANAQLANLKKGLPSDFLQKAQILYNSNEAIKSDQNFEIFKSFFKEVLIANQYKTTDNSSLWSVIQNDPIRSMCGGNFEDSIFHTTEWSGGYGHIPLNGNNDPLQAIYTSGIVPAPNTALNVSVNINCPTTSGQSIPDHATETHQTMVSYGNDPLLGALLKTTNSAGNNYAFRLGNSCVQFGTEYISKKFVVSGNGVIKFNYALVMDGIHSTTSNPAFLVKVYDNSGNPINNSVYLDATSNLPMDNIVSSSTNPFFQHFGAINYRDWTCGKIDLHNYVGQTVTVVLITIDCSGGAHYGYAYIDNWCGNCEGSTTGTLTAVADSCLLPGAEVEVTYTLPVVGNDTGEVNLDLTFYQNGVATGYTLSSPVLTSNGTYVFAIDPNQLPCNGLGYDIVVTGNYTINSASYTLYYPDPMNTSGIVAGDNNDMICCQTVAEICNLTDIRITPSAMGACCYVVEISNQFSNQYFSGITITSNSLPIASISSGNTWSTIAYQDPNQVVFEKTIGFQGIPTNAMGWQTVGTICFAGNGSGNVNIGFIGSPPKYDTICNKTFPVSCGTPIDTSCAAILDLQADCDSGIVTMQFKVKNNANFTMRGITLYPQTPGVSVSPQFIPIADLLPGQTTTVFYETTLQLNSGDTNVCFFFAACDQNTVPGENGQYPQFCCMDSILYCVSIPSCNPCDAIEITAEKDSGMNCCYKLTLSNGYTAGTLKCVRFRGYGGAQFALLSGWNIQSPVSSSDVTMCAPGGTIYPVTYVDFASFCLTGTSTPPHQITIEFIDDKDSVVCVKELSFDSCELVTPSCASIVDDSLYCADTATKYSFYVKNNSPFDIYQLDVRISDTSVHVDQNVIVPNSPILMGATGGPFTIAITDGWQAGKDFCIYLSAHNNIYNLDSGIAATQCCTDSLAVLCFPYFQCNDSACCNCCDFSTFAIPTGITPNSDTYNDQYDLHNPDSCTNIRIVVYNRWGNIVYEESNYNNNWKGTNKNGEQLPQGTYFVVIELPTGHKRGTYLDIRY